MSLLKTLAKVAIGIAVAKGVGSMMNKGKAQVPQSPQPQPGGTGGGLGDILEQLGGGGSKPGGGLGDLLEQLGGGARSGGKSGGGLGDLIGNINTPRDGASDSLGDIFGDFIKGRQGGDSNDGSFGDIFNQSIERRDEPEIEPSREQEIAAALMLRAMIQAAKSDGRIDESERQKLLDNLGDVSREERRFVEEEFAKPVDIEGLARQVPRGFEQQVYLMSVMGIDLDSRAEAQYLHDLAEAMDISREEVNGIHDHLGVVRLYS